MASFSRPPPSVPHVLVSFPRPHILLVTLNRPKQLNTILREMHASLDLLFQWFDAEPALRCAVLTGAGRAFCAGADLKDWDEKNKAQGEAGGQERPAEQPSDNGFAGLSDRRGRKPVIGAVNGLCLGGGMEVAINLDMVLAHEKAKFGLPEVTKGVVAIAGALPRLTRIVGRQRASEMALLGRMYTAEQMREWGLVNKVVKGGASNAAVVVDEAIRWAEEMTNNSPDSVLVSREGLVGGWDGEDPRASTKRVAEGIYQGLVGAENMLEGVRSFVEKRKPVWKDSKL